MSETNKANSDSTSITERIASLCPPAGVFYRLLFARGPVDSIYMGQPASEPPQEASSEKPAAGKPDEADEPYVQELPTKEKVAWMMLDRCRLKERLVVSELKAANRSLLHAKDDEEREQWRNEVETQTLALIACRREARKYLGKSKLPPHIAAFADAKPASDAKPVSNTPPSSDAKPPSDAEPPVEKPVSTLKSEATS